MTVPTLSADVGFAGELIAFATIGALGSGHCLGMCGPLVTVYGDQMTPDTEPARGPTWRELRQHGLFNLGRTLGYAAVGGLVAAVGAAAFDLAALTAAGDAIRALLGVAVGVAIAVAGLGYLTGGSAPAMVGRLPGTRVTARLESIVLARVEDLSTGPGILVLGGLHALLPCPLLYPVYLYGFARGTPLEASVLLAAFGLGTFPTLFGYGTALGSLLMGTRQRLHRVLGAGFVLLSTVPLAHGLALLGVPVPHVPLPMPA